MSGFYDGAACTFDGESLRRAIVGRGWTVRAFAHDAAVNIGTVYNALAGRRVTDETAIRIFKTLEKRRPMELAC